MIFGDQKKYDVFENSGVEALIESLQNVKLTPKIVPVEPEYTGFYFSNSGDKIGITYNDYIGSWGGAMKLPRPSVTKYNSTIVFAQ